MKRLAISLVAVAALAAPATARQLQTPTDWKWRTDAPAKVTCGVQARAGHVALRRDAARLAHHNGPGRTAHPTGRTASGNFTLEAQIFLFPGTSQEEYGVFLGVCVARRDGNTADLSGVRRAARWPGGRLEADRHERRAAGRVEGERRRRAASGRRCHGQEHPARRSRDHRRGVQRQRQGDCEGAARRTFDWTAPSASASVRTSTCTSRRWT